ncbi:uncharacterized protein LOC108905236 [Anoplophora glabripennis]|uniref:uncharacterized protein LOC108905236 n=1 Tax=Anoplophora glabripennis TaxID=217634 RepID=UPI0008739068|nr:uncharacterized protein LOC108905236 [Anoplophora glabripennis]
MNFLLRVMDVLIFNLLWMCYVVYNRIISIVKRGDDIKEESTNPQSNSEENCKRHFIHLYTTSGSKGRPVCYMDVYEMFSPMDEKKLRHAASRGFPNKTYFRYNQGKLSKNNNSQGWMEYSTLTL